jgi:predicted DNA-binding transcriptional regulator AlpA
MAKNRIADQFSDTDMEQIKRYGQALGGGPTDFDEEVERELMKRLRQDTRQMLHDKPHLRTVTQVAKYLGVSRATVYRWAGTRLPRTWLNGIRLVFDIADIERYEKQHPKS